jgi:hypothetical protein
MKARIIEYALTALFLLYAALWIGVYLDEKRLLQKVCFWRGFAGLSSDDDTLRMVAYEAYEELLERERLQGRKPPHELIDCQETSRERGTEVPRTFSVNGWTDWLQSKAFTVSLHDGCPIDLVEVSRILRDEVIRARMAYQSAHTEFNAIATDVQSGEPTPNGALRLGNAGAKYRSTMEEYYRALNEFNALLNDGTVPERLMRENGNKALAANA